MKTLLKMFLMSGLIALTWTCTKDEAITPVDEQLVFAAEETSFKNLSFPVIWAYRSQALDLSRTTYGAPEFAEENDVTLGTLDLWLQGVEWNKWQASTFVPQEGMQAMVNTIDWGDNLEARSWKTTSVIRVEVSFYNANLASYMHSYSSPPPHGFTMYHYSGQGTNEVWGTDKTTYDATVASVYTNQAGIVIQRIGDNFGEVEAGIIAGDFSWDENAHKWDGAEGPKVGPHLYSAEINVQGKVIYGYNWNTKKGGYTAGIYRITYFNYADSNFSLDGAVILDPSDSPNDGGKHYVNGEDNITYIDVMLTDGGSPGGGGSGNGGGGSGHGGPH